MRSKIEIHNLNLFYSSNQVLKNITIEIPNEKVTAVIGPSGCGKSSFLRTINRMNDLIENCRIEGDVFIDGHNIYDSQIDVFNLRKNIGMVFQKSVLFPNSIIENVTFGLKINGITDKQELGEAAESVLRKCALWDEVKDRLNESAMKLSAGQQQRLCFARALVLKPEVLLLDEPASDLDPISTYKIEELIHELKKSFTILISTHNLQQAARVSDYTAFINNGELIEFNKTTQLFTVPGNKLTEDYITGRFR